LMLFQLLSNSALLLVQYGWCTLGRDILCRNV
jgi:hypothetical protein